jgi:hypothetical protein
LRRFPQLPNPQTQRLVARFCCWKDFGKSVVNNVLIDFRGTR